MDPLSLLDDDSESEVWAQAQQKPQRTSTGLRRGLDVDSMGTRRGLDGSKNEKTKQRSKKRPQRLDYTRTESELGPSRVRSESELVPVRVRSEYDDDDLRSKKRSHRRQDGFDEEEEGYGEEYGDFDDVHPDYERRKPKVRVCERVCV